MKQLAITALLSCLLANCGFITILKTQKAYAEQSVSFTSEIDTIPIGIVDDQILLKVSINGEDKQFLLDTGAGTCIDKELSNELSYKKLGKKKISGTNGQTKKITKVVLTEFKISNTAFSNNVISIYDFSHLSKSANTQIDGIIGANSMNSSAWQINYSDSTILITQKPELLTQGLKADTVYFNSYGRGTPELALYTNHTLLSPVWLDTGSNGVIDISTSLQPATPSVKKQVLSASINNIQSKDIEIAIMDSLSLENQLYLDSTVITFTDDLSHGLMGNKFLKNYRVTIDWISQRLILDPIESKKENTYHTNYGLSTYLENSNVYVSSIYEHSEAYLKGVRLNDQVLSINGESMKDLQPETYKDFINNLKASELPISLEILISGAVTTFTLNKTNQLEGLLNP